MTLAGKTIVILGGSSGIGLATARGLKAEGANVVITGRSPDRLKAAQSELGGDIRTVPLDVQDEPGTSALFAELDHVDHVFITAGEIVFDPQLKGGAAATRPALDTRFWGAYNAARFAASKIRDGGSITFMSGTAAIRPLPGAAVGTASCAAVEGLARALAVELKPIRVNVIQPGLVDTPFLDLFGQERRDAVIAEYSKRILVGRPGTAEEIADAVLFLMKNAFVTGITLTVDGGGVLA
jgi:NAD(P)-dependent dehydrogenase (short-subunit alcohol dehydrogenase family)